MLSLGQERTVDEGARLYLPFRFETPIAELDYQPAGPRFEANLTLHVRVLSADGRDLVDAFRFFGHAYPVQPGGGVGDARLNLRGWLEAVPGSYRLEAALRNIHNGREAVAFAAFTVPAAGGRQ